MIDFIKGTLVHIEAEMLVVETGGIGYQLITANPFRLRTQEQEQVIIYTYQYVREDTLALYGFVSREERALFEKLLQVSGVGPKVALAILGSGLPADIIRAIQGEDIPFLTQFPGIGKKTAQRLILELKDKLDDIVVLESRTPGTDIAEVEEEKADHHERAQNEQQRALQEAINALQALGYAEKEIRLVTPQLREHAAQDKDTESCVRLGLQLLLKT